MIYLKFLTESVVELKQNPSPQPAVVKQTTVTYTHSESKLVANQSSGNWGHDSGVRPRYFPLGQAKTFRATLRPLQ